MGERVTITHPRRSQPRVRRRAVTAEIDAQTQLGAVYMRSLLRAQLRLGLAVGGLVLGLLGLLPIVFALVPAIGAAKVLGIPLPWLALGILVYPALVAAAWVYVRHAERNERDFVDLVHRR